MNLDSDSTARLEGNVRRFTAFRLFYTARFYYPVFTVLFLDYGVTLEQFALLNLVWALSIVVAEVPSGALADILGHKRLLVFAALLMVLEMALLVFVPLGASPLLFLVFLLNRICSGLSEAAASGADEALAYDSLKSLGREAEWPKVLERTTWVVSIGFFTTMILGAFAYDPSVVNSCLALLNAGWMLEDSVIVRLPVMLTLVTACLVLFTALGFHDLATDEVREKASSKGSLLEPFRQISRVASWTVNHRFVLFVILAALTLDSVARQFVVLASEYYRLIDIPVSWFGFIGAGMSLIGILNARISRILVSKRSPFFNFLFLSVVLMAGLIGISYAVPYVGVFFAIGAFAIMGMVQFQASYYLNREADSQIRATVLSFKGLALNLGLGTASLLYTTLVATLRYRQDAQVDGQVLTEQIFLDALAAFPVYYLLLFVLVILAARRLVGDCSVFFALPVKQTDAR